LRFKYLSENVNSCYNISQGKQSLATLGVV
jgi:hypothetical protein